MCNKKNSHLSSKCPILKMPKPSASFCGSGKKELAFVQIAEEDHKSEATDSAPTGLVTVTGAQITADVVQSELARITRTDWQWEAIPHGAESFLVAFPIDEFAKYGRHRLSSKKSWSHSHSVCVAAQSGYYSNL